MPGKRPLRQSASSSPPWSLHTYNASRYHTCKSLSFSTCLSLYLALSFFSFSTSALLSRLPQAFPRRGRRQPRLLFPSLSQPALPLHKRRESEGKIYKDWHRWTGLTRQIGLHVWTRMHVDPCIHGYVCFSSRHASGLHLGGMPQFICHGSRQVDAPAPSLFRWKSSVFLRRLESLLMESSPRDADVHVSVYLSLSLASLGGIANPHRERSRNR